MSRPTHAIFRWVAQQLWKTDEIKIIILRSKTYRSTSPAKTEKIAALILWRDKEVKSVSAIKQKRHERERKPLRPYSIQGKMHQPGTHYGIAALTLFVSGNEQQSSSTRWNNNVKHHGDHQVLLYATRLSFAFRWLPAASTTPRTEWFSTCWDTVWRFTWRLWEVCTEIVATCLRDFLLGGTFWETAWNVPARVLEETSPRENH